MSNHTTTSDRGRQDARRRRHTERGNQGVVWPAALLDSHAPGLWLLAVPRVKFEPTPLVDGAVALPGD